MNPNSGVCSISIAKGVNKDQSRPSRAVPLIYWTARLWHPLKFLPLHPGPRRGLVLCLLRHKELLEEKKFEKEVASIFFYDIVRLSH